MELQPRVKNCEMPSYREMRWARCDANVLCDAARSCEMARCSKGVELMVRMLK
jgi:hypothetical protein